MDVKIKMHLHERTTNYNHMNTTHTPKIKKEMSTRVLVGFIKIASSSGVINARTKPWVDASVLKVKSLSLIPLSHPWNVAQTPLHSGGKKMQFLIPLKKSTIYSGVLLRRRWESILK